ncbi:MAG: PHP domain-containing protein [Solirubrobacterales bacterium]|nr:PHP domain-containing protein [Solirubrobacterales bacterium]
MDLDPPSFDLQSHSQHSDGALMPEQVVAEAAAAGVELLALSDHDSVEGVQDAVSAAPARGIRVVSAVEITAIDAEQRDLHILGYRIDHQDRQLRERLERYRGQREQRADEIAQAIRAVGFELDEAPLRERAEQGKSIGRPHLAEAVVSHPANAERLADERLEGLSAFLEAYLIEDRPAFVPRRGPSVAESIETIHDAAGVAVWAHPFWDIKGADEVLASIEEFRGAGLDGVECFYPTHERDQAMLLAQHCASLELLSTGSSDYHGPEHKLFSRFRAFSTYGQSPNLGPIAG